MVKDSFFQSAAYASAEARRLSLAERLAKRADQPFLRRIGKAAAGNFFRFFVHVPESLEEKDGRFDLIGGGLSNLVYASDDQVLKINIRTLDRDLAQVESEVAKSAAIHAMCEQYMGEHWPKVKYSSRHFMDRYAVEARFPRFFPVETFESVEDILNYEGGEEYVEQLESLFGSIAELYRSTGFYPDILGKNNIALISDDNSRQRLVVLDTDTASPQTQQQTVPNQNILIKDAIASKMDLWDRHLKSIKGSGESHEVALR